MTPDNTEYIFNHQKGISTGTRKTEFFKTDYASFCRTALL